MNTPEEMLRVSSMLSHTLSAHSQPGVNAQALAEIHAAAGKLHLLDGRSEGYACAIAAIAATYYVKKAEKIDLVILQAKYKKMLELVECIRTRSELLRIIQSLGPK